MYSDLPDEEASKWAAKLQHQSIGVFGSTTAHAAWRYIPSTYVVAKQDKSMISKEYAHMMINAAKEIEPTAFDVVEEHDGGHCIMLSQPEWLAGVLRRAAGESV